ncbi:LacI family DNA-binding transcriptional regulator [Streptomyces sp. 4N509B]|uniref:LacI family DNA-binding transcriptional regulator n=1 Tax=Streptomyces sp. 4N509B TaxID=3457413 RepID=UPI003FCF3D04
MSTQDSPAPRDGDGDRDGPAGEAAGGRPSRPTLRDVAALAGVSVATASQALRDGPVRSSTRQAVRDAARKLRYVPQAGGSMLRTGRSRTVGLWILNRPDAPELTEGCSFFYPLVRGALQALESAGYGLRFSALTGAPGEIAERLATVAASGSPAGFVVIPQWSGYGEYATALARVGVPVVTINADAGAVSAARVTVDHAGGVARLVAHLAELGHRRIAYLAGPGGHVDADLRLVAFYRAAAAHGLRVAEAWVHRVPYTIEGGEDGLRALLAASDAAGLERPSALLGGDDYVAAGAIRHATGVGIAVPGAMSVVGFDDVDVARATVPALTTVRQPLRELGRVAAEQVLALIAGTPVEPVELPVDLVLRDSAAPPPR